MSLTTKNIATVTLGVAMVLVASFALATPAKAQSIADLQAMINSLLAQIQALQGTTPGGSMGGTCNTFTKNHQQGDTGGEVMWIQQFLNKNGYAVSATGAGSPGNESTYFGAKTKAAIAKWQAAAGISPAAGYWGPISRAKANTMCVPGTPGVPGTPVSGNGLKVMLAAGSPVNVALVQGQAIGELARFTLQNPTASEVSITSLGFNRIGVSNDEALVNVYLYEGATRLTDSASVSNTAFNFNDSSGVIKIPAGGSKTISVRSDILSGISGQQIGVSLVSVGTSATLDTSVKLPIVGGIQTISAATLATVDFNSSTSPSASSVDPQNDYVVWQNTASIGNRAVNLETFTLEALGSNDADDVRNFRLYVDGVQIGSAVNQANADDMVVFDLSASPKRLETGGRVIKVVADIVGGSGETMQYSLRRASDIRAVDTELNQPVLATYNSLTAFSARSATSATIASGTVSVTKAASSPNSNVSLNASNVKWATFEMRSSGENVKVTALGVDVAVSSSADGLDNGKVFLNGVQVGSTKDLQSKLAC